MSTRDFSSRKTIVAGAALALLIAAVLVFQHHESVANFAGAAHERAQAENSLGGDLPASIGSAFTPVLW
jgi:hypothetical protein